MLFGLSADGEFRVLYPRTGTSPIVADDGYVYSVGLATDTNADQVLLRLQQDGGPSVLYAFPGGEARVWPAGGLVQAVDGHLYGMTQNGGERGHGSIYRISVDGSFRGLHEFELETQGGSPFGRLTEHSNGILYGVATCGGARNLGTVFGVTVSGGFKVLHTFEQGHPEGSLVEGEDGNLYGLMVGDRGAAVFRLSTEGVISTVRALPSRMSVAPSLAMGEDGYLYGVDRVGGGRRTGSIWRISTSGRFGVVHVFPGGSVGETPQRELIRGIDGNLYGTTVAGGLYGCGTIFRLTIRP
jgi:uncharacterized repeat protein (TIGR03803 family)